MSEYMGNVRGKVRIPTKSLAALVALLSEYAV